MTPKQSLKRTAITLKHHIRVRLRHRDETHLFLKRTISAQIHFYSAILFFFSCLYLTYLCLNKSPLEFYSAIGFGVASVLLFSASAFMHFMVDGFRVSKTLERILEDTDKIAIYFLIASTYTAIAAKPLTDPLRTRIILAVWSIAVFGIFYTIFRTRLPRLLASRFVLTAQFLAMGWLVVFFISDLLKALTTLQFSFIIIGGLFYSVGAISYALERPRISKYIGFHEIWHTFVTLGSLSFLVTIILIYS